MKRIGIYFFCVIAIGCMTSSILYWETENSSEIRVEKTTVNRESEQLQVKETDATEETENIEQTMLISRNSSIHAQFFIIEEDGYLVIYNQKTKQRYDETTILVNDLPERLQEQLKEGLYFDDEEALYEFLENYSS